MNREDFPAYVIGSEGVSINLTKSGFWTYAGSAVQTSAQVWYVAAKNGFGAHDNTDPQTFVVHARPSSSGLVIGSNPSAVDRLLIDGAQVPTFTLAPGDTAIITSGSGTDWDVILIRVPLARTTAQLADKTNSCNTRGKIIGRQVFNTTTGKPVYATGVTDVAVWNDATGTLAHTPA